jgi:hypothetical protein
MAAEDSWVMSPDLELTPSIIQKYQGGPIKWNM